MRCTWLVFGVFLGVFLLEVIFELFNWLGFWFVIKFVDFLVFNFCINCFILDMEGFFLVFDVFWEECWFEDLVFVCRFFIWFELFLFVDFFCFLDLKFIELFCDFFFLLILGKFFFISKFFLFLFFLVFFIFWLFLLSKFLSLNILLEFLLRFLVLIWLLVLLIFIFGEFSVLRLISGVENSLSLLNFICRMGFVGVCKFLLSELVLFVMFKLVFGLAFFDVMFGIKGDKDCE